MKYDFDYEMQKQNGGSVSKMFGDKEDEYNIYLSCADDGTGHEIMTGKPLLTYDEWLNH